MFSLCVFISPLHTSSPVWFCLCHFRDLHFLSSLLMGGAPRSRNILLYKFFWCYLRAYMHSAWTSAGKSKGICRKSAENLRGGPKEFWPQKCHQFMQILGPCLFPCTANPKGKLRKNERNLKETWAGTKDFQCILLGHRQANQRESCGNLLKIPRGYPRKPCRKKHCKFMQIFGLVYSAAQHPPRENKKKRKNHEKIKENMGGT